MGLKGPKVGPFGPKLGQNDAPELRNIFQALLGPKTQLKKSKTLKVIKIPIFTVQSHPLYTEIPILTAQRGPAAGSEALR